MDKPFEVEAEMMESYFSKRIKKACYIFFNEAWP